MPATRVCGVNLLQCYLITADRELYQRQIDATDRAIDRLDDDLYGLTDEEIRIVEESARK